MTKAGSTDVVVLMGPRRIIGWRTNCARIIVHSETSPRNRQSQNLKAKPSANQFVGRGSAVDFSEPAPSHRPWASARARPLADESTLTRLPGLTRTNTTFLLCGNTTFLLCLDRRRLSWPARVHLKRQKATEILTLPITDHFVVCNRLSSTEEYHHGICSLLSH